MERLKRLIGAIDWCWERRTTMWEYMGSYNGGWGGMGLGTVGMSLFWILTIVAILATLKPTTLRAKFNMLQLEEAVRRGVYPISPQPGVS
jgi:hypothetical protein